MNNKAINKSRVQYEMLFPTLESKAMAFDKVAEKFYFINFGSSSKSDIDVLMFSIYLEQILGKTEYDLDSYSDYTLSKLLGITQNKVSNLKVKKELLYPYQDFSWKDSFGRILRNYRYENGKIKIYIPDKNLYYEIKNVIESNGGFVDVQLNSTLLQINPEYFVDLVVAVIGDKEKNEIKNELKLRIKQLQIADLEFNKKTFGESLKDVAPELMIAIVGNLLNACIPMAGTVLGEALKNIVYDLSSKK